MKNKTHTHFNESERRRIGRLLTAGLSIRSIAGRLDRSPGSLSDEIKRNSVRGVYNPKKAEEKARNRRKYSKIQSLGALKDPATRRYVENKLRIGWSAELSSGRWRYVLGHPDGPSTKAVYKFLYSPYGRNLERYMPSRQVKKKGGPKRKRSVFLDGRRRIAERPKTAETRLEFGHFELDFIESGRDGRGSLLSITERMARYPFLVYAGDRGTEHINALVAETLAGVPVLSVTADNDLSLQKHKELSKLLSADIFFCDSYCSWQKATVENRNGAARRKLPKGTDFSQVSRAKIMAVEHELRHRPMKCLGFRTPFEVWTTEMKKYQTQTARARSASRLPSRLLAVNIM